MMMLMIRGTRSDLNVRRCRRMTANQVTETGDEGADGAVDAAKRA